MTAALEVEVCRGTATPFRHAAVGLPHQVAIIWTSRTYALEVEVCQAHFHWHTSTHFHSVQYDVAVQSEAGQPDMHVVLIEVLDPSVAARPHYAAHLLTRSGHATGEFLPAVNDPPGRWTIRATDYATRVTGSTHIVLSP